VGEKVDTHQSRYDKISEYASIEDSLPSRFAKRFEGNAPNIMSTNLGKLDIPHELGEFDVERAYFVPSSASGMEIISGISTINGKLTILLNYYEGYVDADIVQKVRVRVEEILRDLMK
jgi:NRPS condensation-like uncharacterized protein